MTEQSQLLGKPQWLDTKSYSIIFLIISAMSYSTMGFFLKMSSSVGIPFSELVFVRSITQAFVVALFMTRVKAQCEAQGGKQHFYHIIENEERNDGIENNSNSADNNCFINSSSSNEGKSLIFNPFGGTQEARKIVMCRGILGGIGLLMNFFSIKVLLLGDAITLTSLNPIATIFLAAIFLREMIRVVDLFAVFCSVTGAILIVQPSFIFGGRNNNENDDTVVINPAGYFTALGGVFVVSVSYILVRKAGELGVHTLQLVFSFPFFAVFFSILVAFFEQKSWIFPTSMMSFWYLFWCTVLGVLAALLWNYVFRFAPAGVSSIALSSDIMWGYLIQVVVLGQVPSVMTCFGVGLVVLSLLAIAFQNMEGALSL